MEQAPPTRTVGSLAVPLIGNLCQVYGLLWFLLRTPPGAILTWPLLLRTAAVFLIITALAHLFALWINRRLFSALAEEPFQTLAFALWPSLVWMPLLVLLQKENSVWIVLLPPLIAISAITALRRWSSHQPATAEPRSISTLFQSQEPPSFFRILAPATIVSVALQGSFVELAVSHPFTAGFCFAVASAVLLWTYPGRLKPQPFEVPASAYSWDYPTRAATRAARPRTIAVLLLLIVALIPYLKPSPFTSRLSALLGAKPPKQINSAKLQSPSRAPGNYYSGIILLLPPKPRHQIEPPPPPAPPSQFSAIVKKPIVIPFDGAYWYFRQPDPRPRPDARVVHGDPTKAVIRSTDFRALSMEAHQHLGKAIQMDCCSAIRVAIQNADDRPGTIAIEVQLQRTDPKGAVTTQSLGLLPIHSSEAPSIPLNRPAIDEVLTFPFPPNRRDRQFDEITIIVRPAKERSRAGAHIAIQQFTLVP